jgi:hypothetical protein
MFTGAHTCARPRAVRGVAILLMLAAPVAGQGSWNGSSWSIVPSPNVGTHDNLLAVAAVSGASAWAVGAGGSPGRTLIERWNGTAWKIQASPN